MLVEFGGVVYVLCCCLGLRHFGRHAVPSSVVSTLRAL